jgi:hypothetical protein
MNHLKFVLLLKICDLEKKATLKFVVIWSQNFVGVKGLRFVLLVGSSLTCIFYCDLGK